MIGPLHERQQKGYWELKREARAKTEGMNDPSVHYAG